MNTVSENIVNDECHKKKNNPTGVKARRRVNLVRYVSRQSVILNYMILADADNNRREKI